MTALLPTFLNAALAGASGLTGFSVGWTLRRKRQIIAQSVLSRAERLALERLQATVNALPEGLAVFDQAGRYLLWNARYAELAFAEGEPIQPGTTFVSVLRTGLAEGIYEEAVGREEAWLEDRLRKFRATHSVHEQKLASGRWLRVDERRSDNGEVVASLVDITELKAKEASLRLLFEANPAPMIVLDAETMGIIAANDAALVQYGWSREEMLQLSILDLLTEVEQVEALDLRGRGRLAYEADRTWGHKRADGTQLSVLPYMREVELDGRKARLLALLDVTGRQQAEEELVRTRRLLDTIVEHVPTLLAVKNLKDGRYVLLNRPGELLTGWEREKVVGRTNADLFPPKVAAAMEARDEEALARAGEAVQSDAVLHGAAGVLEVQSTRVVLPGPTGDPEFMMLAVQDVSERKAQAATLAAALAAAEQANRAKSEFLANMSHEIRTPLNGVLGVASVLERGNLQPEQRSLVEIITSSATTLERLLSDILDLASVEEGLLSLETQVFQLDEAVRSISAPARLCAHEKELDFHLSFSPGCDVPVRADPVRLRQILTNLLNNAVKFTSAGSVTLRVVAESRGFRFDIVDTGPGFSEEVRQRLFGRFQQADGSITRRFGGSGLGLAISRNLATLMGGELSAESKVGVGSTFSLTLPLSLADQPAGPSAPANGETLAEVLPLRAGLRVLAADDNVTNQKLLGTVLEAAGASVDIVSNGQEAVEAALGGIYDLLILDARMPVLDGYSALQQIRSAESALGRRTPALVLSADAGVEAASISERAGADLHMSKPYQAAILLERVAQLTSTRCAPARVAA